MRRFLAGLALIATTALCTAAPASAAFGLAEFDVGFATASGQTDTLAGSHPFAMNVPLRFDATPNGEGGETADSPARDVVTAQIPGFVGDPTAVPACTVAQFATRVHNPEGVNEPACPDSTVVGYVAVRISGPIGSAPIFSPVYNVVPPPGRAARLGFWTAGVPVPIELGVSEEPPYEVLGGPTQISQAVEVIAAKLILWGEPTDPAHDPLRGNCLSTVTGESNGDCPADVSVQIPFLTLPRACAGPLRAEYAADAWANPGSEGPAGWPDLSDPAWLQGESESAVEVEDCASLGFSPSIEAEPTEHAAETSSGLDFDLKVSDPGLTEAGGRAGSDIEKTVVTLPEGITTNPAVAGGLGTCGSAEYAAERLGATDGCPAASQVGTVEVETPLLAESFGGPLRVLHGKVFVARQGENPFHSLLALYLTVEEPQLGIFIKLAGKVSPDPSTGQLTTSFDGLPQLPFSHLRLHLRSGPRAPLITPATCAAYAVTADLYPYAGAVRHETASFTVDSGADGGSCAHSPAEQRNSPSFSLGTVEPVAGAYSPIHLRVARQDGDQQISQISTTLPPGLLGRLAGISYCPESGIAQAQARGGEGEGALELARPSCPASSEVGTVTVGAGAGPDPYYVTGHAYLAGPYKGAPLSLEIITPAIAGPFDLGVVAVRTSLAVDPFTTQITATSDPIPHILHGLPLDVRSISLQMGRPDFTLNPTNCEPMAIGASATSTLGLTAPLSARFQVGGCGQLKFKPHLKISLNGATKRTGHPGLKAVLTYPKQGRYANIIRAQVGLPHAEFLEQNNLNNTCTRPVLIAGNCPKSTVYGHAKAWSPLLEKPLGGPVYLVGGFGYKLPALVADLNGQIRVLLVGRVDTTKQNGIRNTFEVVPDAPVSRFVLQMKGGKKYSLLVNSEDLCAKTQRVNARFVAQNNRVVQLRPVLHTSCPKRHKRTGHSRRR